MATSQPQTTDEQTRIDEHTGERCPDCRGRIVPEGIERVCQRCGLVAATNEIDHGPEWRNYSDGEDKSRCHVADRTRDDNGLGTMCRTGAARDADQRRQFRWHSHARASNTQRREAYLCAEVRRIAADLEVPWYAAERGQRIARQNKREGINGWALEAIAAASLYVAIRCERLGWSANDIAETARCEVNRIRQGYRKIARDLSLEVPPPDVVARVGVVAGRLKVDTETTEQARQVVRAVGGGGSPSTLAAYALWSESGRTQRECAEAAGCSTAAIRHRRDRVK